MRARRAHAWPGVDPSRAFCGCKQHEGSTLWRCASLLAACSQCQEVMEGEACLSGSEDAGMTQGCACGSRHTSPFVHRQEPACLEEEPPALSTCCQLVFRIRKRDTLKRSLLWTGLCPRLCRAAKGIGAASSCQTSNTGDTARIERAGSCTWLGACRSSSSLLWMRQGYTHEMTEVRMQAKTDKAVNFHPLPQPPMDIMHCPW